MKWSEMVKVSFCCCGSFWDECGWAGPPRVVTHAFEFEGGESVWFTDCDLQMLLECLNFFFFQQGTVFVFFLIGIPASLESMNALESGHCPAADEATSWDSSAQRNLFFLQWKKWQHRRYLCIHFLVGFHLFITGPHGHKIYICQKTSECARLGNVGERLEGTHTDTRRR